MTEDEKTEPTEETGAATDKAADSTDAQTQTEAKADAEAPEIETPETGAPETETATEQKDEQEAEAAPSVEDRLAETNDQLLRALAELENTRRRADRDRAEALKYGAASFARDMLGLPIIYSVHSTPWPSWIRTLCPMPQNPCSKVLPRPNAT